MNMSGQYRQFDHLHTLFDGATSQEFLKEGAGRRVNHRPTIEGAPCEMEEELMGSQAIRQVEAEP